MTIAYAGVRPGNSYLDRSLSATMRIFDGGNKENVTNSFDTEYQKKLIFNGLRDALLEASRENIEGYSSLDNTDTLRHAIIFLKLLPADFPFPKLSLDNDGDIAIEWDYESRRLISIRIGKDGTLNFAWLVGHTKMHGVEVLKNNIPETILIGIQRVLGIRPN